MRFTAQPLRQAMNIDDSSIVSSFSSQRSAVISAGGHGRSALSL